MTLGSSKLTIKDTQGSVTSKRARPLIEKVQNKQASSNNKLELRPSSSKNKRSKVHHNKPYEAPY
jgi:hypothetical protein